MALFPDVCRGCKPPKRQVGCHSTCPEYLAAKEEHEKIQQKIRNAKDAEFADHKRRRRIGYIVRGWRDDR